MKKSLAFLPVLAALIALSPMAAEGKTLTNPGTLPDSPFYFLDRLLEDIGTLLTLDKIARIERKVALAEERLAEARSLTEKEGETERVDEALAEYESGVDEAVAEAGKAKDEGEDGAIIDDVLAKLTEESIRHQAVLAEVYANAPEAAKEAIERAMEASAEGHAKALKAVSKEKREEIRDQIEEEEEEALERLEDLRESGVPVPELKDDDDEDLSGVEDELDDIEDDMRSATDELEDELDEFSEDRGPSENSGRR